jgi:hypothetical protein
MSITSDLSMAYMNAAMAEAKARRSATDRD